MKERFKKREYTVRKKKSNMHLSGVPDGVGGNGQHDNVWECSRIDISPQKQEAQGRPNRSQKKKKEISLSTGCKTAKYQQ